MPDSQSREPGFNSPLLPYQSLGIFVLSTSLLNCINGYLAIDNCINGYLAIDSGGNESDLVIARNCCMARMLPREVELVPE